MAREIPCGPYIATVSEADYEYLSQWRWTYLVTSSRHGKRVYARRGGGRDRQGGYRATILMHVVILERAEGPRPDALHTPNHRDWDTLNNQRDNLHWASKAEQNAYQRRYRKPKLKRQETEVPF